MSRIRFVPPLIALAVAGTLMVPERGAQAQNAMARGKDQHGRIIPPPKPAFATVIVPGDTKVKREKGTPPKSNAERTKKAKEGNPNAVD